MNTTCVAEQPAVVVTTGLQRPNAQVRNGSKQISTLQLMHCFLDMGPTRRFRVQPRDLDESHAKLAGLLAAKPRSGDPMPLAGASDSGFSRFVSASMSPDSAVQLLLEN